MFNSYKVLHKHVNTGSVGCDIPNLKSSQKILRKSECQACSEEAMSDIVFLKGLNVLTAIVV